MGHEVGPKNSADRDRASEQFNGFIVQKREFKLTGDRQGASRQRGQGQKSVQVTRAETTRTGQGQAGSKPREQSGKRY